MSALCWHSGPCGRRRYRPVLGRRSYRPCQDCGRPWRLVTFIRFWATGMPYYVCSDCIRAYRGVINHPEPWWQNRERICRICGGTYNDGNRKDHVWAWHWWCKTDTCSRHHRHAFNVDVSARADTTA